MTHTHKQPFESFVAPARARATIWWFLLGLCLIALVYGLWSMAVVFGYGLLSENSDPTGALQGLIAPKTPVHMFVILSTFIGMALGPLLVVRWLHNRAMGTLFGPAQTVIVDFSKAVLVTAVIYGATIAVWFVLYDAVPNLPLSRWLMLLPLTMVALLIQTGAEELLFRGYLQQQLAARFAARWVWMLIPSLLFGFAHYDPATAGDNLWYIVLATGLFGLIAADLTARTGSIGAAWGLHFANNMIAVGIIAVDGTLPGLALFLTPYGADDPILQKLIWLDMATLVLVWLILTRILRR